MKSTRMISYVALLALGAACEGEPPKTPAAPAGAGAEPAPSAEAEPEPEATAQPAASAPAPANTCACCPCGGPVAAGDAGAADGGAAIAAVVPPPPPASLAITGTVSSHGKPLPVAVVYLEDAPIAPNAKMSAWIDNKGMGFFPFLTVIPVGGKVTFHNGDPFPHNVFSPDAEKFNMGTIAEGGAFVHTFSKPGEYSLLCNLHPNMLGYLVVTPSSYFGKTDAKGRYAIKAVPPGTYKITAWAPRLTPSTSSVTVADKDATIDFDLQR